MRRGAMFYEIGKVQEASEFINDAFLPKFYQVFASTAHSILTDPSMKKKTRDQIRFYMGKILKSEFGYI